MKKKWMGLLLGMSLFLNGCGSQAEPAPTQPKEAVETQAKEHRAEEIIIHGKLQGKSVTIALQDSHVTRELLSQLPLTLDFKDFNGTEKIAYPPKKLDASQDKAGHAPKVGDLCLYKPWGNLCIFYQPFHASDDLLYLGRVTEGMDSIASGGEGFSISLENK